MRVGKKDMMEWYIAPYYNSKEQYLFGYQEDFLGRTYLYNFGEIVNVKVTKREKEQRAVYSCCITTVDRAYDCPFFLMRSRAVSPQGQEMIDYWDEIRADCKLDIDDRVSKRRDRFVVGVDMAADIFVRAAALYPAETENVKIPDARVVQANGHAEITYWDKYGNEHRVRLAVSMPGHLMILEGYRQYAFLCIRNDGPETLIVDSGLHYLVRIEPGRVRKIQPENAAYIEEQMLEMNKNIDGMTTE